MIIKLTDSAQKRILDLQQNNDSCIGLHLMVEGGGCSGFSYKFALAIKQNKDDYIVQEGEAKLFVDRASLVFLEGATIDYINTIVDQGFIVINPNAKSSCGCGESFSI